MTWPDLAARARALLRPRQPQRAIDYATLVNGMQYPLSLMPSTSLGFTEEQIAPNYASFATMAYGANPVVFACMEARRRLFSQARFQWQQVRGGTPGKLFGTEALSLLEHPDGPGSTTADLLNEAIQAADLAGSAFLVRRGDRIVSARPDWIDIVAASRSEPKQGLAALDAELVGYQYWPGGRHQGSDPVLLLPEEVAHFRTTKDPLAKFRGMSWLTPLIREIMADQAATQHKLAYFENGATSNLIVKFDPTIVNTLEKFDAWVEKLEQEHRGVANAYKTWYVGAGADPTVLGDNLRQVDFKQTQGAGETRIAAAAGVPPIIVGLSEGLDAATYSNYGQARRAFSDGTGWNLWENIAGSLERILPPPPGARLWVDDRHIRYLQEDQKDRAEIQQMDASALASLLNIGFMPDAAVDAIVSGDLLRLVGQHTGLPPVQVQAPDAVVEEPAADEEEPADVPARAMLAQAEQRLVERGVRVTVPALAAELRVSERTVQRWRHR